MRESVANVNEASLPTGKVVPSAYSGSSDIRIGSAKGSPPVASVGAIESYKNEESAWPFEASQAELSAVDTRISEWSAEIGRAKTWLQSNKLQIICRNNHWKSSSTEFCLSIYTHFKLLMPSLLVVVDDR